MAGAASFSSSSLLLRSTAAPRCSLPFLNTRISFKALRPTQQRSLRIVCSASKTMEEVQEIIASKLSVDLAKVKPETKFSELGADSLDTVEIVMSLEEKFGVAISEESAEDITTVQQIADLIENQKAVASSV